MTVRVPTSSKISWSTLVDAIDAKRRTFQPTVYFFGGPKGRKKDARKPFYQRDNE